MDGHGLDVVGRREAQHLTVEGELGLDRPADGFGPPVQAEVMLDALRAKGVPYAYVLFPGEQHGFRRAESIRRAAEAELSFYGQVLGFEPAGAIKPVVLERENGYPPRA